MRWPSPRLLLGLSIVLFAAFAAGVLLTERPAPPLPPPRPPGPSVTARAGAFAAAVSWRGSPKATVTWGPAGARPLLTTIPHGRASVVLHGLAPNARYRAIVDGVGTVAFRTQPIPADVRASTAGGVVRIDGRPIFPLMTWEECPDRWLPDIADGIDLVGGNPCTGMAGLLAAVRGRALVAGTADDAPGAAGPGLIGWFLPDEADARGFTGATLPPPGGPGLRFLTLTSHFFPLAAPLPAGRGMYPGLASAADVLGFDLYPLQELCRPELLPWVFDAQQALRRLAPGKPTFQWIEEREMKCPQTPVTPATIRVESWLAIAGGAVGLGFFPNDWSAAVGSVIRGIAAHVHQLEPALLTRPLPVVVRPAAPMVRASAREYGGTRYVIAVNAGRTPVRARLDAVPVRLPPLSVRVLTAASG